MNLSVLSTADPLVRTLTTLACSDLAAIITCDLDEDSTTLSIQLRDGTQWSHTTALAHSCLMCSLREAIIPTLRNLSEEGIDQVLLALPVATEPVAIVPTLVELCAPDEALDGIQVSTSIHAISVDTAARDLLTHIPLASVGSALTDDDMRCTGEVLMASLGYADIVVGIGEDHLGSDLIEHLRPFETIRVNHFAELTCHLLFSALHDPDAAIERIHPASTQAWGGPTGHGVWTLDLHSDRPFHPERPSRFVTELAAAHTFARGCFWLPSRPHTVCTWEATGGSASVGTAGDWDGSPFTHVIVTGTHDRPGMRERVEAAFARILMTEEEMLDAHVWVGVDDGLGEWFPSSL